MSRLLPERIELKIELSNVDLDFWQLVFGKHHDIWSDHRALTGGIGLADEDFAQHFDSLRRVYLERFEYDRYRLVGGNKKQPAIARELGFEI